MSVSSLGQPWDFFAGALEQTRTNYVRFFILYQLSWSESINVQRCDRTGQNVRAVILTPLPSPLDCLIVREAEPCGVRTTVGRRLN